MNDDLDGPQVNVNTIMYAGKDVVGALKAGLALPRTPENNAVLVELVQVIRLRALENPEMFPVEFLNVLASQL